MSEQKKTEKIAQLKKIEEQAEEISILNSTVSERESVIYSRDTRLEQLTEAHSVLSRAKDQADRDNEQLNNKALEHLKVREAIVDMLTVLIEGEVSVKYNEDDGSKSESLSHVGRQMRLVRETARYEKFPLRRYPHEVTFEPGTFERFSS